MNDKRKTRPAGGTAGRARQESGLCGAAFPCVYSTKNGADRQPGFIESLLSYGAENGLTLKDLERITDWPGRTIRKAIEAERRAGAVIISDNAHGYYLTDDPAEVQRFVYSMRHRAKEVLQTAAAIEEAAISMQGDSI